MVHIMELFEYELYKQGKSPHTVRSYLSRVKYFLQWLEKKHNNNDPKNISVLDIKEYEDYCKNIKKYAPAGIRQRISAIKAYRNFLAQKPQVKYSSKY
jgi:site-specific recombinase XerD